MSTSSLIQAAESQAVVGSARLESRNHPVCRGAPNGQTGCLPAVVCGRQAPFISSLHLGGGFLKSALSLQWVPPPPESPPPQSPPPPTISSWHTLSPPLMFHSRQTYPGQRMRCCRARSLEPVLAPPGSPGLLSACMRTVFILESTSVDPAFFQHRFGCRWSPRSPARDVHFLLRLS